MGSRNCSVSAAPVSVASVTAAVSTEAATAVASEAAVTLFLDGLVIVGRGQLLLRTLLGQLNGATETRPVAAVAAVAAVTAVAAVATEALLGRFQADTVGRHLRLDLFLFGVDQTQDG